MLRLRGKVRQRAQVDVPRACGFLARWRANVDLYVRVNRLGLGPVVPTRIRPMSADSTWRTTHQVHSPCVKVVFLGKSQMSFSARDTKAKKNEKRR